MEIWFPKKKLSLKPFLGNVTRLSTPWLTPGMEGRSPQEERSRVLTDGRLWQEGQALGCLQVGLSPGVSDLLVLSTLHLHYADVETEAQCASHRVIRALGLDGNPIFKSLSTSSDFLCALSHSEKVLLGWGGSESEVKVKCLEIPALSLPPPPFCPLLGSSSVALVVIITFANLSPSRFFQLAECSTSASSPP